MVGLERVLRIVSSDVGLALLENHFSEQPT
jgi:hypothetical protein